MNWKSPEIAFTLRTWNPYRADRIGKSNDLGVIRGSMAQSDGLLGFGGVAVLQSLGGGCGKDRSAPDQPNRREGRGGW